MSLVATAAIFHNEQAQVAARILARHVAGRDLPHEDMATTCSYASTKLET
jgi:hypothetical protein